MKLKKTFKGLILGNLLFLPSLSFAEEVVLLEKVQIIGQNLLFPFERITQEVSIIPKTFLEKGGSLHSAVDIRKRGGFGVEEDLSIRGTNFEQNLLLIEGLRVSDLQTGHHLMNLPILSQNLSSIEVLTGGASPTYGPSGFGGALNYVLDKPKKPQALASANLGSYDYKDYTLQLSYPLPSLPFSLSLQQKKSNGFIWNRDFDIRTLNLYTKDERKLIFYGFVEKDFGARNFYTPRFDGEWEETRTQLFLAKRLFSLGSFLFEPGIIARVNHDHYLLDRRNPNSYENKHTSKLLRVNLPFTLEEGKSIYTFGLEGSYETLDSTRLGRLLRRAIGLYSGINFELFDRTYVDLRGRYDVYAGEKDFLSLGFGLSHLPKKDLKLRAQANLSYRLPSATELRYNSLGIKGNPELSPEKALNLEGGFDYSLPKGIFSFTLFLRRGQNLIDWVSNSSGTFAENLDVSAFGGTINLVYNSTFGHFILSYTYVNLFGEKISLSRYHGNYLRHNLQFALLKNLPLEVTLKLHLNPQKRYNQHEVYLLGFDLEKRFKGLSIRLWGENLLDEKYYEIYYPLQKKGVLAQPQTIGIGLKWEAM
jgi:iron complex outermembrane receptor protein